MFVIITKFPQELLKVFLLPKGIYLPKIFESQKFAAENTLRDDVSTDPQHFQHWNKPEG